MADGDTSSSLIGGSDSGGPSAGSLLGGAASGASVGAMFGPYGAIAGALIGGLVSAFGSSFKGQAEANMYRYQSGIALMNKQIALQNADYERSAGEVSAQESGMKTRALVGQTEAAQASSGLDVNRGSAVAVRTSELEVGQQDENIIRANAARRAYGYEVEATQDQAQSGLYEMAAKGAITAGQLGGLTSLLSAGTSVADKWSKIGQYYG